MRACPGGLPADKLRRGGKFRQAELWGGRSAVVVALDNPPHRDTILMKKVLPPIGNILHVLCTLFAVADSKQVNGPERFMGGKSG
jgi:hypothetical protein